MTDVYLQLDYRAYKHLERQLLNWDRIETTHVSMDRRYYHKALRLEIGDLTLEIQGPAVREAIPDPDPAVEAGLRIASVPDLCACVGTCERCAA
jgi:hypothetical protein